MLTSNGRSILITKAANSWSSTEQYRNGLGVDLGYIFNSRTELRVGEDVQWFNEHRTIGTDGQLEFSLIPFVSRARFQYLGGNDAMVPTKGSIVSTTLQLLYETSERRRRLLATHGTPGALHSDPDEECALHPGPGWHQLRRQQSWSRRRHIGWTTAFERPYARNELLGTDYFLGQVGYLHQIAKLNPIFAEHNLCRWFVRGRQDVRRKCTDSTHSERRSGGSRNQDTDRSGLRRTQHRRQRPSQVVHRSRPRLLNAFSSTPSPHFYVKYSINST